MKAKARNGITETGKRRSNMDFAGLITAIREVHERLSRQAVKAVNVSLTIRNWLIGCYIREYEQKGTDRAKYGTRLLELLATRIERSLDKCYTERYLRLCRQFFDVYPQIGKSLISQSEELPIRKSPISELPFNAAQLETETKTLTAGFPVERHFNSLSFTHFIELLKTNGPLKRIFYEVECIKGNWSVRELKRQIASLYFERCGLSKDKVALSKLTQSVAETDAPPLVIRDPYVFEFLGLRPKDVMHESDLQAALLDKVEDFLLELGRGFCFEARQKRILIGDNYFFVDLVLYHRILKCHVLLELKLDAFKHEHLGQLNTYLSWFKANEITPGDSPPIGILLCTEKNHALVQYALADVDNQLFVSKYQLKLPSREELQHFVEAQLKEVRK